MSNVRQFLKFSSTILVFVVPFLTIKIGLKYLGPDVYPPSNTFPGDRLKNAIDILQSQSNTLSAIAVSSIAAIGILVSRNSNRVFFLELLFFVISFISGVFSVFLSAKLAFNSAILFGALPENVILDRLFDILDAQAFFVLVSASALGAAVFRGGVR